MRTAHGDARSRTGEDDADDDEARKQSKLVIVVSNGVDNGDDDKDIPSLTRERTTAWAKGEWRTSPTSETVFRAGGFVTAVTSLPLGGCPPRPRSPKTARRLGLLRSAT